MPKIIVLRVGWMQHYQGMDNDPIQSTATFVQQEKYGHEMFNFLPEHGHVYGYVQPSGVGAYNPRHIQITRLGAAPTDASIDHVLVAWIAPHPHGGIVLIGWYQDATVYRQYQESPRTTQRLFKGQPIGYYVTAAQENSVLLKPHERVLVVPKAKADSGGIGQSLIWFADTAKPNDRRFREQLIAFVRAYTHHLTEEPMNSGPYAPAYFVEGQMQQVTSTTHERNLQARAACIAHYGTRCSICNFDFARFYGAIGEGLIHVHHITPIATMSGSYHIDPIRDLRPVCPNCHAIIHRRNPPYALDEIAALMVDKQIHT